MTEAALPIPWLAADDETTPLPDPETALAEPNGLLAIGASLSPQRLEAAYRAGIFPWYSPGEPILWWSPDPRAIIAMGTLHISRSLDRALRRLDYTVTLDHAFDAVVQACAAPRADQPGTWITPDMQAAYSRLHTVGLAHSIEVWRDGALIGGLYGVSLGRAFFGESMFSRATNGSKIAMAWLCAQLRAWEFHFLDCQMPTEHLSSLGAQSLPRRRFLLTLAASQRHATHLGPWTLDVKDYRHD
ncbi:leucyl/phenylalanyl-tRNA--protein transferase [Spiribacter salinus]|uniref:leucyl/phenylalanyl-tRNA--protein transferase n=1 Tax=Spiribacter salinus TaxID=1335746 RepID=UPI001C981856|nr:leucyl/phenylalanyl-tRNA--protein transferase [Spiribacter salinus]